jgi:hypothetical protein
LLFWGDIGFRLPARRIAALRLGDSDAICVAGRRKHLLSQKGEIMNAALELFAKLDDVRPTVGCSRSILDDLPEVDRVFCLKTEKQYLELISQLTKSCAVLKDWMDQEINKPVFEISDHGSVYKKYDAEWHLKIMFSPAYSFVYFKKAFKKAHEVYLEQFGTYFSHRYNLHVDLSKLNELFEKKAGPDLETIVQEIAKQTDNLNFADVGTHNLIKDFRRHAFSWRSMPTLSNNKISIENFCCFNTYSNLSLDFNSSAFLALLRAISYFEAGSLTVLNKISSVFPMRYGEPTDFSSDYEFFACEKVSAIRFYKNHKIVLKFNRPDYAQAFFKLFSLDVSIHN